MQYGTEPWSLPYTRLPSNSLALGLELDGEKALCMCMLEKGYICMHVANLHHYLDSGTSLIRTPLGMS